MKYYVTLFDSNYLTRGLVMYRSLLRNAGDFHLWIVCFDDLAYEILDKLCLEKVTLVSLKQFEDNELLSIKSERTYVEYMWTCTPSVALYVLNKNPSVDAITYLDADLMFFTDPEEIFAEMGNASILLTKHSYLPEFDKSATNGIFNVQFMTFVADINGIAALNWWRERCLEWCFAKSEDNKFGDQKYLDDWQERFDKVHVLQHLGAGLAPWNSAQYSLDKQEDRIFVEGHPLIFYHFHALKIYSSWLGYSCPIYPLSKELRTWVYKPYFNEIRQSYRDIRAISQDFDSGIENLFSSIGDMSKWATNLKQLVRDAQQGRYYLFV
jgi:hypothetical protein